MKNMLNLQVNGKQVTTLEDNALLLATINPATLPDDAVIEWEDVKAMLLSTVYPVGSIYTSVVSTNPATLFGFGTWAAFGAGRVLVGIDAGQTEFDVVEETGGEKTHTLSVTEMPSHNHAPQSPLYYGAASGSNILTGGGAAAGFSMTNAGGGGAHNNLQPYIIVYMWKRTA